ncbi:MAG: dihydrolipoamide acetyltransferase family protein [Actinomycetales bacterium]|nr:dihydrolipoamide acetyltransferase family protein [Actinomycetales bacterium]
MTDVRTFALPDVGEGLTEAEILTWHVKPGDTVTVNQTIVEIETAKAAVELPCPFAGVVAEVFVAEGDVVPVGTPILSIATAGSAAATPAAAPAAPAEGAPSPDRGTSGTPTGAPTGEPPAAPSASAAGEPAAREPVLVGYGVKQTGVPHRRERVLAHDPHGTTAPEAGPPGEAAKPVRHGGLEVGRHAEEVLSRSSAVLAKPPVRRLARDLQVDLAAVDPTGAGGVITRADVERTAMLARSVQDQGLPSASHGTLGRPTAERAEPREVRTPIKGVTKLMAEAMVASAFTAPHVTEWVEVDVTRTLGLVERLRARPEFEGVKVSPLLLVATGLIRAARRYPGVNATWDAAAGEIVTKNYVNLGIAAATPRGLVVPNVKDADLLDLVGLARALQDLVDTARAGRTLPSDMAGGTITITNVGVFGVDGGTPIINPGESAILAMGRALARPWVVDGEVRVRQVMQLTLSFDHRLVDGALGSRVLADVARFLEDPAVELVLG